MKSAFLLLLIIAIAAVVAVALKTKGKPKKGSFARRDLATANEQNMYWQLVKCLPAPEYLIFTQVALGALLTAKGGANRNTFSQKIADFVVTDKSFKTLAIIELDDSSHRGKEKQDENRDSMLKEAGYKTLRYKTIPDPEKILSDMAATPKN